MANRDDEFNNGWELLTEPGKTTEGDGPEIMQDEKSEKGFKVIDLHDLQERKRRETQHLELEHIEAIDEGRRRIFCGLGALIVSLPFITSGVRETILGLIAPDQPTIEQVEVQPETAPDTPPKPPKPPRNPKKLGEAIQKNPQLIIKLLNKPDRLKKWFPKEKKEAVQELIAFININKNKSWAKPGIWRIKNEINNGKFRFPRDTNSILAAKKKYFPDMPLGELSDLASIITKLS